MNGRGDGQGKFGLGSIEALAGCLCFAVRLVFDECVALRSSSIVRCPLSVVHCPLFEWVGESLDVGLFEAFRASASAAGSVNGMYTRPEIRDRIKSTPLLSRPLS
jgi:hypothetical protein